MSEYQYLGFRAIDGPVSDKNLKFMRQQSTRAEITPWSFDNEYHFGDFGGDAEEMLRRGYDFHLHYANFGTRKLMIRIPDGLPDPKACEAYSEDDSFYFLKDKHGQGGILGIEPYYEPDDLEELYEFDGLMDRLLPLRAEILDGDLRPMYLAHLAVACDCHHDPDEATEGPVPAGLKKPSDSQRALAEFYGIPDSLIAAAAQNTPPLHLRGDSENDYKIWLQQLPEAKKQEWLAQLMADPSSTVRRDILAEFNKDKETTAWPTVNLGRRITELRSTAEQIQLENDQRKAAQAARKRAEKLSQMAADPMPTIRETEELVQERSRDAYSKIAGLLTDLRQALAGHEQSNLPEMQARKLKENNPTLRILISELRAKGFLKK